MIRYLFLILFLYPYISSAQPGKIYTTLSEAIKDPRKVYKLELRRDGLEAIPEEVFSMTNLEELYLEKNSIVKIPKEIGLLTNLKILDLDQNQIDSVPPEIGNLILLEELDLDQNKLVYLSPEIGLLKNLRSLDLHQNLLSGLPSEIGNLDSLVDIEIYNNKLQNVPAALFQMKKLTSLRLDYNELTSLPSEIKYNNFDFLSVCNNKLTTIPKEIINCTELRTLDVRNNLLLTFPTELSRMPNLETIYLSNNKINYFPSDFSKENGIILFYLNSNELDSIPFNLTLPKINLLNLSGNKISKLPTNLTGINTVENLYLENNKLTALPSTISQLKKLEIFNASNNELTKIPKEICSLKNLTYLLLGHNQISKLPAEMGLLVNLFELNLYDNPIQSKLTGLEKMTHLTNLSLLENQLKYLPDGIKKITSLRNICVLESNVQCIQWGENYVGPEEKEKSEEFPGELTKETWLNYLITAIESDEDCFYKLASEGVTKELYKQLKYAANENDLVKLLEHPNISVRIFAFQILDEKKYKGLFSFIKDHFNDTYVMHKSYTSRPYELGNHYCFARSLTKTQRNTIDSMVLFGDNDYNYIHDIFLRNDTVSMFHDIIISKLEKYPDGIKYIAKFNRESDLELLEAYILKNPSYNYSIMDLFPHPYFIGTVKKIIDLKFISYPYIDFILKLNSKEAIEMLGTLIKNERDTPQPEQVESYVMNANFHSQTYIFRELNRKSYPLYDSIFFELWKNMDVFPDSVQVSRLLQSYPDKTYECIKSTLEKNKNFGYWDSSDYLIALMREKDLDWLIKHTCKTIYSYEESMMNYYNTNFQYYLNLARSIPSKEIATTFLDIFEKDKKDIFDIDEFVKYVLELKDPDLNKRLLEIIVDRQLIYSGDSDEIKKLLKQYNQLQPILELQKKREATIYGRWKIVQWKMNGIEKKAPNWAVLEFGIWNEYLRNFCESKAIGRIQVDSNTIHFDSIHSSSRNYEDSYVNINQTGYYLAPLLATSAVPRIINICRDATFNENEITEFNQVLDSILIGTNSFDLRDSILIIKGKGELHLKLQYTYLTDWKKPIAPPVKYEYPDYPVYQEKKYSLSKIPSSIGGIPIANYLKRNDIDSISKLFIQGKYAFYDYDDNLSAMLDSALTQNPETQKFYFYLLNRIIGIAQQTDYHSTTRYFLYQRCSSFFIQNPCYFFEQVKSGPYSYNYFEWKKYLQRGLWWEEETEFLQKNGTKYRVISECGKYKSEIENLYKWMDTYIDPAIPVYEEQH